MEERMIVDSLMTFLPHKSSFRFPSAADKVLIISPSPPLPILQQWDNNSAKLISARSSVDVRNYKATHSLGISQMC